MTTNSSAINNNTRANSNFEIPSLSNLPQDILSLIFQNIDSPKDFYALSSGNRRLAAVSQLPASWHHLIPKLVPNYIDQTADPAVLRLSPEEKCQMSVDIEKKLVLEKELIPIFQKNDFPIVTGYQYDLLIKDILGDYLFFALPATDSHQEGIINVYNLKTRENKSLKTDSSLKAAILISADKPLLATIHKNGYKIWDLNQLMASWSQEVEPIAEGANYTGEHSPVVATHQQLLAIGNEDSVLIMDCNKSLTAGNFIQFDHANQIHFTDTHLILVNDWEIAVWELAALEKAFGTEQKIPTKSASINYRSKVAEHNDSFLETLSAIGNTKIYGDKMIIAYQHVYIKKRGTEECDRFVGEIINWKKGKQLQLLTSLLPSDPITSMDVIGNDLIATSHNAYSKWNLTNNRLEQIPGDKINLPFKVYMAGKHVLIGTNRSLEIWQKNNFCQIEKRNPSMKITDKLDDDEYLDSFDLHGPYLIKESSQKNETIYNCSLTRSFSVYNLKS